MNRSDLDIRHDVESELQWDPSIDERRIGVIVCSGIVTLTGEVAHLTGRWAAEEITKPVQGVRAIANEIQVKIPLSGIRSDSEIAEATATALRWDVATASSAITPVVQNGCVTLSGKVTWGFQKLAAERAIRPLLGVRHVSNQILITSAITADRVKRDIEQALQRHARVGTRAIDVKLEGATIVLTGHVHSWQEQSAAIAAAWAASGVAQVENQLEVR